MSSPYARKVDQQCVYINEILALLTGQNASVLLEPLARIALVQAAYLQLEMALRFYLLELSDKTGKRDVQIGFVENSIVEGSMIARLQQENVDSAEIAELGALIKTPISWLAILIEQLADLRKVDLTNKLKGSIFQLEEDQGGDNLIISTSSVTKRLPANLDDLVNSNRELHLLITRQRSVSEEF